MKRIAALFALMLTLVATSANAQTTTPPVPTVNPPEVCIIPKSPQIEMTMTDEQGNPVNVWASAYFMGLDGKQPGIQVSYSNCQPASGEPQGCFSNGNGKGKFNLDTEGKPLPLGIYQIMAYGPQGYDGAIAEVHAENGGIVTINMILRRQTVSITMNPEKSVSVQGHMTLEFFVNGHVPDGAELYTVISVSGPTNQWVTWEAYRKPITSREYREALTLPSIFVEGAPTGFQICNQTFISQKGMPTRPLAQSYNCVINSR